MKNTNVRIKDIAERAQVSVGTVDRVIHNRGRVAPDVEERVLRILRDMNYEPNLLARALGSKKKYRIAALIPDPDYDPYWHGPMEGLEKAEAAVMQYGVSIKQYLFNPYTVGSYVHRAKQLTAAGADGILVAPIFYRETLPFFEEWKAKNIPFVLFNTQIPDSGALSYVGQDSYQSGMLAGGIIHYGQYPQSTILVAHIDEEISNAAHLIKKEQGFRDYFKQNGLEEQYKIMRTQLNRSDLPNFADKLSGIIESIHNLQSIYVTTSKAHSIAAYLEQNNINHIKLIGYDLLPQNLEYLNKGRINFLINQNPKGQGYWGIYQLVNHLVFKKEVQALKYLPLDMISKENAAYYTKDIMIYADHNLIA
ncbi:MAG: substrate-binding protein [Mucilaginibacter sp.]|nr:substrate-binding protein [Mucilaginibacter sp.]